MSATAVTPKFYHLTNCNRAITGGGIQFHFSPYELCGTWLGVYPATTEDEIKALDELVKNPKSGVTEITEEYYGQCVKKKASASNSYTQSLAVTVPLKEHNPVAPSAATNSVNPNPEPAPTLPPAAPLESADEAVEIVQVGRKPGKK